MSDANVTALHDAESVTISYTVDDDGIHLSCICSWEHVLPHESSLADAMRAQLAHEIEATGARLPVWEVLLTDESTAKTRTVHVHAASEEDARRDAGKLWPDVLVGMASRCATQTPGSTESGN